MIAILNMSQKSRTVTNLARTLAVEKYSISRAMSSLEKEGLINKADGRYASLTKDGEILAYKYSQSVDSAMNFLISLGIDSSIAYKDAMVMALCLSESSISIIKQNHQKLMLKQKMSRFKIFDGSTLCANLGDGVYKCPFFMLASEKVIDKCPFTNNMAFVNPCNLVISNNVGTVKLKVNNDYLSYKGIRKNCVFNKIFSVMYFDGENYIDSEKIGNIFSFPADRIMFDTVGKEENISLLGSVKLKIIFLDENNLRKEQIAIYTIVF